MTIGPGLRRLALTAHLATSVGWIGAVVAYLALGVSAATAQDADTAHAAVLARHPHARGQHLTLQPYRV